MDINKVNISKENETSQHHVNISKEKPEPVINTAYTDEENRNIIEEKIDMEKIHNTEQKVNESINNGVESVLGATQNVMDKLSNGVNNFIDNLDKPKQNQDNTQNYNQYGTNNQQNYNQQYNQNVNKSGVFYSGVLPLDDKGEKITPDSLTVEPELAAILSFLVSGLGQMLNGQVVKGAIILGVGIIGNFILGMLTCGLGCIVVGIPYFIAQIVDAYKCAKILKSGGTLRKYEYHILG